MACANFNPPGSTDDAEQDFVGSGPEGFDRWDTLYPFAPKPLLISVSDHDAAGTYSSNYISNGWEEFQKLQKIYAVLGKPDELKWADTPLPHGLSYDSRLQVYNFFRRHLQENPKPVEEEPPVQPEADATLWVAEGGNVKSLGGPTPFRSNKARQSAKSAEPLEKLLRLERPPADARLTVLQRVPSRGIWIEAVEVASAPQVWLPGWIYRPRNEGRSKPLVIAVDPAGHNTRWHEGELYQNLALKGYTVLAAGRARHRRSAARVSAGRGRTRAFP